MGEKSMLQLNNKSNFTDKFLNKLLESGFDFMKEKDIKKYARLEKLFKTDPKYIKHYADTITESDDGTTADVFLQLVVIGDVIYG